MVLFLGPTAPYGLTGPGTSTAAPHVVGAAVLLLARNPNLSYAQLKDLILSNVDPLPALAGKTVSGGRLNIYRALAAAPAAVTPATSASSLFSTARLSVASDLLRRRMLYLCEGRQTLQVPSKPRARGFRHRRNSR